jgi:hypothetical protein
MEPKNMKKNRSQKPKPKPISELVHVDIPFQMPQDFLRQLFEFSPGGYVLLTIGSDGRPQAHANFDNLIAARGFQVCGQEYFEMMAAQLKSQCNWNPPTSEDQAPDTSFE